MSVISASKPEMLPRKLSNWAEFKRAFTGIRREETIAGYLFILPNLLGFLTFTVFPIFFTFYLSTTQWDIGKPPQFVGLHNFTALGTDELFWKSLGNSFYYTFGAVPIGIFLAFVLALLLNQKIRGVIVFRTIYFLPQVTLVVASAIVWNWIYQPDFGLMNYLLSLIGIHGPKWIFSSAWAMPSVIIYCNWMGIAPSALILLAGLQGIPEELYEAAEIDGASEWGRLRYITVPLITPALFFVVVTSLIGAMQTFSQFYILTKGGPNFATTPLVMYIFNMGFSWFKFGNASAIAIVLFAILLIITLIQWRVANRWVYGFSND
jgi:multiple sugar transport system permease protein